MLNWDCGEHFNFNLQNNEMSTLPEYITFQMLLSSQETDQKESLKVSCLVNVSIFYLYHVRYCKISEIRSIYLWIMEAF